MATIKDKILT